ncbi:hypothetical protein GCM10010199_58090 [Dactylosporangium roseum]
MRGIDMPGLNLRDVRKLPVPLPDLQEQIRVVTRLEQIAGRAALLSSAIESGTDWAQSLEQEGLRSIVYGEIANSATSEWQQIWADRTPEVRLAGVAPMDQQAVGEALAGVAAEPSASHRSAKEVRQGVAVSTSGMAAVDAAQLVLTLRELGGSATPEEVFTRLNLSEVGVDSFYLALREAVANGEIEVPPGPSTVLTMVANEI